MASSGSAVIAACSHAGSARQARDEGVNRESSPEENMRPQPHLVSHPCLRTKVIGSRVGDVQGVFCSVCTEFVERATPISAFTAWGTAMRSQSRKQSFMTRRKLQSVRSIDVWLLSEIRISDFGRRSAPLGTCGRSISRGYTREENTMLTKPFGYTPL